MNSSKLLQTHVGTSIVMIGHPKTLFYFVCSEVKRNSTLDFSLIVDICYLLVNNMCNLSYKLNKMPIFSNLIEYPNM